MSLDANGHCRAKQFLGKRHYAFCTDLDTGRFSAVLTSLERLTSFCSCSRKMKVSTVFGLEKSAALRCEGTRSATYANLSQAGVHPLKRNRGPSLRSDSATILLTLCSRVSIHSTIT